MLIAYGYGNIEFVTSATPPMTSRDEKNDSSLRLARAEAFLEAVLRVGELVAVIVLTLLVWVTALGTILWILGCPTSRLPSVVSNLNQNWKACLLMLIPLFYRTIQAVLQRIKKWPWGMESQEAEEEKKEKTPKEQRPSPTPHGSSKEEA